MKRFIHNRLALAVAACAVFAVASGSANAVSVTPMGAAFTATTNGGAALHFSGGTVSCSVVTTNGTIPSGQDNSNTGGSVTMTVTAPVFRQCLAYSYPATVQANATEGNWTLTFSSVPGVPQILGTLTAPPVGVTVTMSTPYSCILTEMWGAQTPATGLWNNAAHTWALTNQQVPIVENGTTCPPRAQFGTLSATFSLVAGSMLVGVTGP